MYLQYLYWLLYTQYSYLCIKFSGIIVRVSIVCIFPYRRILKVCFLTGNCSVKILLGRYNVCFMLSYVYVNLYQSLVEHFNRWCAIDEQKEDGLRKVIFQYLLQNKLFRVVEVTPPLCQCYTCLFLQYFFSYSTVHKTKGEEEAGSLVQTKVFFEGGGEEGLTLPPQILPLSVFLF